MLFMEKPTEIYNNIVKNDNFEMIPYVYVRYCIELACETFEKTLSEEEKNNLIGVVYDYYSESQMQIVKVADTLIANYEQYINDENFDIYEYEEKYD